MLEAEALGGRPCALALRSLGARPAQPPPRTPALVGVQPAAGPATLPSRRRRAAAVAIRASAKPGVEEGMAAAGADLNWGHVARDVKRRLAAAAGGHESKQAQLQSWSAGCCCLVGLVDQLVGVWKLQPL